MKFLVIIGILGALVFLPQGSSAAASVKEGELTATIERLRSELNALLAAKVSVKVGVPTVSVNVHASTPLAVGDSWRYRYAQQKSNIGREVKRRAAADTGSATSTYTVKDGVLQGKPSVNDRAIFALVADIAGAEMLPHIGKFSTYRDPQSTTLAAVEAFEKSAKWGVRVNATGAVLTNPVWMRDMAAVLIHEIAHIATLNSDEVNQNEMRGAGCTTLMSAVGCVYPDSYIYAFAEAFWDEGDHERGKEDALVEYRRNKNDYVTAYAAKNIEEDMAETFTEFVLNGKPSGDTKVKDAKVLFFYQYPELIQMRMHIRGAVGTYFLRK